MPDTEAALRDTISLDTSQLDSVLEAPIAPLSEDVRLLLEESRAQAHVRHIGHLDASSESRERQLATYLAGIANAALLTGKESGYLIFDLSTSRVSYKPLGRRTPRVYRLTDLNQDERRDAIRQVAAKLINPDLEVGMIQEYEQQGYLSISAPGKYPCFVISHDGSRADDWALPMWDRESDTTPRDVLSDPVLSTTLFEIFFRRLCYQYGADVDEKRLLEQFAHQKPRSTSEFAGFLAGLLISINANERALAADALGQIAGLPNEAWPYVTHLLVALLEDEPEVAEKALLSIRRVGNEQSVRAIITRLDRHEGIDSIFRLVLDCVADLGSLEQEQWLTERAAATARDGSARRLVDHAIVRLRLRHGLNIYDDRARDVFIAHLDDFQYAQALQVLQRDGHRVCLPAAHRHYIISLLQSAVQRAAKIPLASWQPLEDILNGQLRTEGLGKDELDEIIRRWREAMDDIKASTAKEPIEWDNDSNAREVAWLLAELFYLAELQYLRGDVEGFLYRWGSFHEMLRPELLRRLGVTLTRLGSDVKYEWCKQHTDLAAQLKQRACAESKDSELYWRQCFKKDGTLDRNVKTLALPLCEILSEPRGDLQEGADLPTLMKKFAEIYRLRNDGTHRRAGDLQKAIENAYGASLESMLNDIKDLYLYVTNRPVGARSFRRLNIDVKWILDDADREYSLGSNTFSNL
jgi:hypothetical protein